LRPYEKDESSSDGLWVSFEAERWLFYYPTSSKYFYSPQVSAFPLLMARYGIQLFMTMFGTTESLVCKDLKIYIHRASMYTFIL